MIGGVVTRLFLCAAMASSQSRLIYFLEGGGLIVEAPFSPSSDKTVVPNPARRSKQSTTSRQQQQVIGAVSGESALLAAIIRCLYGLCRACCCLRLTPLYQQHFTTATLLLLLLLLPHRGFKLMRRLMRQGLFVSCGVHHIYRPISSRKCRRYRMLFSHRIVRPPRSPCHASRHPSV